MGTKLSVPSTPSRLTFVLNDFSGGIVNNVNDVKMNDNESPDMLNMQFRIDGLIQKRPGLKHVFTPREGTQICDCIPFEYAPNEFLYIYRNMYQMYYENYLGNPVVVWEDPVLQLPPPHTSYPAKKISWTQYMNSLIFADGTNLYSFAFDGEEGKPKTCKFVLPPSDYTPLEKPHVTGETKDKFIKSYKYLHYNKEEGHDYRDETYTEVDESGTPYYVDEEGLYVYKNDWTYYDDNVGADLHEKWYEPCQYEIEDGYKGIGLMPPGMSCIEVHKDRLYVAGSELEPNLIFVSDILNPYYFPSGLTLQTPPNDDYITALHNYNDVLIIGRRDSLFALFGNTNKADNENSFNLVQLNCHTGMVNSCSANKVYHMLFFVGSDGNMYKLLPPSTISDTFYTTQLNTKLDITLPPFDLSIYDCLNAVTVFDKKDGLWYIQIGDHTLVYNYSLMAWTRYNNINAVKFFNVDNKVQLLNTFGGIYEMPSKDGNQEYCDDVYESMIDKVIKVPVNAYWTSRNMDMNQPARVKQFRDTYVTTESFENYSTTVNVKYEVDYIDIRSSFLIENEIAKWDKAIWDKSKFTSRNIDRSLPLMINRRGRTLKVYYGSGYKWKGVWLTMPDPIELDEYDLFYCKEDNIYYIRVPRQEGFVTKKDKYFKELTQEEFSQALLVHNITGIYELKGYR